MPLALDHPFCECGEDPYHHRLKISWVEYAVLRKRLRISTYIQNPECTTDGREVVESSESYVAVRKKRKQDKS